MSATAPKTELENKLGVFHESLGGSKLVRDPNPTQTKQSIATVEELIEAAEMKEIKVSEDMDLVGAINSRIASLDEEVDQELNKGMHQEEFCKHERSWRGLHYLVNKTQTSTSLKLRL